MQLQFLPYSDLVAPSPFGVLLKDLSYLSSGSSLDSRGQSSLECVGEEDSPDRTIYLSAGQAWGGNLRAACTSALGTTNQGEQSPWRGKLVLKGCTSTFQFVHKPQSNSIICQLAFLCLLSNPQVGVMLLRISSPLE